MLGVIDAATMSSSEVSISQLSSSFTTSYIRFPYSAMFREQKREEEDLHPNISIKAIAVTTFPPWGLLSMIVMARDWEFINMLLHGEVWMDQA